MEIHEGSLETHASGHTMVKKILRVGYYWMTMEVDCYRYVQTCHKFQIYADKIHVPPVPLNVLKSPRPFSMWGIDVIQCIESTSSCCTPKFSLPFSPFYSTLNLRILCIPHVSCICISHAFISSG